MRYFILLAEDPQVWVDLDETQRAAVMQAHWDFDAAVRERATMLAGEALTGAEEARTLRPGDEGRVVTDGPFAEAAEHLGGFYLIDAPDLETITSLCQVLPPGYTIEIRPCVDMSGYDEDGS